MIEQTAKRIEVTADAPQSAARLFAVLTDPRRHTEIDGSGMLQGDSGSEVITAVGQAFTMAMRYPSLGHYRTVNTVVAFEADRVIGWATAREGNPPAGVRWTWELTPAGPDQTTITHTYDWSRVTDPAVLARVNFPRVSAAELEQTVRALIAAA